MNATVGIDQISFYIPYHYIDLATLAERQQIDVNKFYAGIGQEKMSMAAHDEDIVTLAANAALPIIEANGTDNIDSLFFATESGIDQSKAAGIYVHQLLDLKSNCRVVEFKQACYSATAALQMACSHVARHPQKKVLVIASDISRYDLNSAAEATQGCGAVAMLISQSPRILQIDAVSGTYTEDVMDFWRPNYRKTALVDGRLSARMYLKALKGAWQDYQAQGGRAFSEFSHFCYHLPFSKMGEKAHKQLAQLNQASVNDDHINSAMLYNRIIGNSYTASLYIGLASLLDNRDDLSNQAIALFSYGSGCVGEFFSGTISQHYLDNRYTQHHQSLLQQREALDYERYLEFWHYPDPSAGEQVIMPRDSRGTFRLHEINDHQRHYQRA